MASGLETETDTCVCSYDDDVLTCDTGLERMVAIVLQVIQRCDARRGAQQHVMIPSDVVLLWAVCCGGLGRGKMRRFGGWKGPVFPDGQFAARVAVKLVKIMLRLIMPLDV